MCIFSHNIQLLTFLNIAHYIFLVVKDWAELSLIENQLKERRVITRLQVRLGDRKQFSVHRTRSLPNQLRHGPVVTT